jgi:hypothetical protein
MPGLLPDVDPEGLLEYSVVYSDRALNHMSRAFQGVMNDISSTLKRVYAAKAAVVVPGSGTFGMEAVARQFATGRKCLVVRNGWFSYRWTQIFDMGGIPGETTVLKARPTEGGRHAPYAPPPVDEVTRIKSRTWCSSRTSRPHRASSCPDPTCARSPTPCTRSAECSSWIPSLPERSGSTWRPSAPTS